MKYIFLVTVFLFGSFFVGQKLLAANSDMIINEIGAYPSSTHEWIEVWNKGNENIDLSSWKFWENNTNHSLKAVSTTDSVVSVGEYAVVCQDGDVFLRDFPNFIGSVFDSSWSVLSEGGEEVGLKDGDGNFIERFTYLPTTNFSLERKDSLVSDYTSANWQEHVSGNTVGVQNSNLIVLNAEIPVATSSVTATNITPVSSTQEIAVTTTVSTTTNAESLFSTSSVSSSVFDWSFIKLNEILSDPSSGNEMVELYNNSSSSVDINEASICDYSGANCKIFSGNILGFSWLSVDLLSDRYLNNSGDNVILKDEQNNVVDQVVYGVEGLSAPQKGQSLIRKFDGVDTNTENDWAITTYITMGDQNQLVLPLSNSNNNTGGYGGISNNVISQNNNTSSTKISTSTIKSVAVKDPVNISWKLDWPFGLDINEIGVFSAVGSADPRGGELNFMWNFGDNNTSTGFVVSHSYPTSGVYVVSVIASSSVGTAGKKDFKIYVGPEFALSLDQIKVNNFFVNATSSDDEFIEIKNLSTSSKNISGWKIKNNNGKEYVIPENTNIAASGTLKFWRAITHLGFDKDGDGIILATPNNKVMDKVVLLNQKETKKLADKKEVKNTKVSSVSNWQSIQGVVTVLPGVFGSQYFYISDGEKGYQVYQYKKDFPLLKIGDNISVNGELSEVSGVDRIKILNKNNIRIINQNNNFKPLKFGLDELGDQYVGMLVEVSGEITSLKSNYLYIDDGNNETIIYFRPGAKINKQNLKLGDSLEVVGIVEQTNSGLRVVPRGDGDIKIVGHYDKMESLQTGSIEGGQSDTQEKYLTATAGGLTTLILGFLAKNRGALVVGGVRKIASLTGKIIKRG